MIVNRASFAKDLQREKVCYLCLRTQGNKIMVATEREVVPGLTSADVKEIADQIYNKRDGNHPQLSKPGNGFIDILRDGKPDISASPVFIRKANL